MVVQPHHNVKQDKIVRGLDKLDIAQVEAKAVVMVLVKVIKMKTALAVPKIVLVATVKLVVTVFVKAPQKIVVMVLANVIKEKIAVLAQKIASEVMVEIV